MRNIAEEEVEMYLVSAYHYIHKQMFGFQMYFMKLLYDLEFQSTAVSKDHF